jgi:hypothetical protein
LSLVGVEALGFLDQHLFPRAVFLKRGFIPVDTVLVDIRHDTGAAMELLASYLSASSPGPSPPPSIAK